MSAPGTVVTSWTNITGDLASKSLNPAVQLFHPVLTA